MELSVIIVNYNTRDKIGECLSFLSAELADLESEIIVIDNASTDDSVKVARQLTEKFKHIKLIQNEKNLGFAKAVNQGLRNVKGDYIFLLNPDTKVLPGAIKLLLDFAKKEKNLGVVGPKLLNKDNSEQSSARMLPTLWGAVKEYFLGRKGAFEGYVPKVTKPSEVEAVVGAAMFIPKKIIEEVGFFDERYFLYYEDLDFCRRARRARYKIFYLPEARVIHLLGASGTEIEEETYKELLKSSKIYHGAFWSFLINLLIFWGQKWSTFLKILKS